MKLFFKLFSLLFIFSCMCICSFGCNKKIEELISQNVSEYRENFFYYKDETLSISFTDGKREKDYIMNGIKTELVDFGVIVLRTNIDFVELPRFELKINEEKIFINQMERNPIDLTYVFDVETCVNKNDKINIYLIDINRSIDLTCLSKTWGATYQDALEKFIKENSDMLSSYITDNKFKGEVFIKLVADKNDSSIIYYYLLCICEDNQIISSLIDVNTLELVQKQF